MKKKKEKYILRFWRYIYFYYWQLFDFSLFRDFSRKFYFIDKKVAHTSVLLINLISPTGVGNGRLTMTEKQTVVSA